MNQAVSVAQWNGAAVATPTIAGVPEVDVTHWIGTLAATPTVAGVPEVDVTHAAGTAVQAAGGRFEVDAELIAGVTTTTAIANAVWNEDATGHQTTGTFGQAIGDPVADTNTIYGGVVTGAAGATIAVDVIAIQADTDNIQTRLPTVLVSGRMDSSVGAMATDVITAAAIAVDAIGSAEFSQAAANKVFGSGGAVLAELAQAIPPATPRPDQAMMLLYQAFRNLVQVTATEKRITNDAGVVIAKKSLVDDGVTYSETEMISGP